MDGYDEALFDDLAIDEAEGAADMGDEGDEFDAGDSFDEGDEFDAGDEFDSGDEGDEMDELDSYDDEFDSYDEGEGDGLDEDSLDRVIASALAAEDSDEFLRRLAGGIRRAAQGAVRVAQRVAPVVGQVARTVAPIARMIPGPWGAAIGGAANVLGQLMADEASEDEAFEAFAELATRNRAALPIAAGLAARRILGPAAARMSPAQRLRAVRTVRGAATQMVNRAGAAAARGLPRVASSVRRTSVARRTPAPMRPQVLARTAARAVRQPGTRSQLTRPLPRGQQALRRAASAVRSGHHHGHRHGGMHRLGGRHRRRTIIINIRG